MKKVLSVGVGMCIMVFATMGVACASSLSAYSGSFSPKTVMNQQQQAKFFTTAKANTVRTDVGIRTVQTSIMVEIGVSNPKQAQLTQQIIQGYQTVANRRIDTVNKMAAAEYNYLTTEFQKKETVLLGQLKTPGITAQERKTLLGQLNTLREDYKSDMAAARKRFAKMLDNERANNKENMNSVKTMVASGLGYVEE